MDDVEKRMEEIRATAESIDSGGISEGADPQAWIYRNDVIWLLTQLTEANDWREKFSADYLAQNRQLEASREECERLRAALTDALRDEGYP